MTNNKKEKLKKNFISYFLHISFIFNLLEKKKKKVNFSLNKFEDFS